MHTDQWNRMKVQKYIHTYIYINRLVFFNCGPKQFNGKRIAFLMTKEARLQDAEKGSLLCKKKKKKKLDHF